MFVCAHNAIEIIYYARFIAALGVLCYDKIEFLKQFVPTLTKSRYFIFDY